MLHVLRPVYISYIHTSVAKTLVCFSNTNSCVFPIRTLGILFLSLSCLIYCRLGLTHFVAVWNRICSELNFLPFFKTCFFIFTRVVVHWNRQCFVSVVRWGTRESEFFFSVPWYILSTNTRDSNHTGLWKSSSPWKDMTGKMIHLHLYI
jgi:hypothetical protein